jgi:hypothetical protein
VRRLKRQTGFICPDNKSADRVLAWINRHYNRQDLNKRQMDNIVTDTFGNHSQLKELRIAHRDLDVAITELVLIPHADQLRVRRLKKQKLRIKDMINKLESGLIPDINA